MLESRPSVGQIIRFTGTQVLGQFGETGSEYPKSCARTHEK